MIIHVIFEIYFLRKKVNERSTDPKPEAWDTKLVLVLTVLPSLYLWLLFVIIPLSIFIEGNSFYFLIPRILSDEIITMFQLIGIVLISVSTLIAILGRLARGKYAISWGIPAKVVNTGIFRYIRHPLYSSYILYFIGFQLLFLTPFLTPLLLGIIGYYWTAIYEESILVERFGEEYSSYMGKTKKFIPFFV